MYVYSFWRTLSSLLSLISIPHIFSLCIEFLIFILLVTCLLRLRHHFLYDISLTLRVLKISYTLQKSTKINLYVYCILSTFIFFKEDFLPYTFIFQKRIFSHIHLFFSKRIFSALRLLNKEDFLYFTFIKQRGFSPLDVYFFQREFPIRLLRLYYFIVLKRRQNNRAGHY